MIMPRGIYNRTVAAKKNMSEAHIGKRHSKQTREKMVAARSGKLSGSWLGDLVGYSGIHQWIRRVLGQPHVCEFCGKKNLRHRQYHWANVSGEYLRDISDWIRLCVKCHKNYDLKRIRQTS